MKFRYFGDNPIYDVGLSLEKRSGADITGIRDNHIIKKGDVIETTDEKCIKIMKSNPYYEMIIEETKKVKKPKKELKTKPVKKVKK